MGGLVTSAQAGTLESNDILITVLPTYDGCGVVIELESIVLAQYGEAIRQTMRRILEEEMIEDIYIKAVDRGALDFTIEARVRTALERAGYIEKEAAHG